MLIQLCSLSAAGITKPTLWQLASHDMRFTDPKIAELRQVMDKKVKEDGIVFESVIYPGELAPGPREPKLRPRNRARVRGKAEFGE